MHTRLSSGRGPDRADRRRATGRRIVTLAMLLWTTSASAQWTFTRGDCNGTPSVNVADAVAIVTYLFVGTFDPPCIDACDSNDDGVVDVSDPVYLLQFLFQAGPALPEPYPACGSDPTPDALDCAGPLPACPVANEPPTITSSPPLTALEGSLYTYDVEADDPDLGDTLTFSLETLPTGATIDPASGVIEWTPTDLQLGEHDFTVRVTDLEGEFDEQSFVVTVTAGGQRAELVVTPSGTITASTYGAGSFQLTNQASGPQRIVRFRLDLRTALLPDLVFDPVGLAGDTLGKCFTADIGTVAVGLIPPADICVTPFLEPHDGGYDILEVFFDDFDPGETFGFSVDNDPTSIQGAPPSGSTGTGSVSGLELAGSIFTVEYDDGTIVSGELYRVPGSVSGSQNVAKASVLAAPTLELVAVGPTPVIVADPNQTVRITGTPGSEVALLDLEGALLLSDVPSGGFDIDPFEANTLVNVDEFIVTLDGTGVADVPVVLTRSIAEGGIHTLVATAIDSDDSTGSLSNRLVIHYDPFSITVTTDFAPTADVHVDSVSPDSNLEGADGLRIASSPDESRALLRFDLTGLDRTPGLVASYFDIGVPITSVVQIPWADTPDFTEVVPTVDIAVTTGSFWPGGPVDQFASRHKGEIFIPEAGDWTFSTTSNDGSVLLIDGNQIVNNDGQHGLQTVSATIGLTAGYHDIEIRHFENVGSAGLFVELQGPGFPDPTILPPALLSHGFPRENVVNTRLVLTEAACCAAGDTEFEVRQVLEAWDPVLVTWNLRPAPEPVVLGTITLPGTVAEDAELVVDLDLDLVLLDDTLDLMLIPVGGGVPLTVGSIEGPPAARLTFEYFEE